MPHRFVATFALALCLVPVAVRAGDPTPAPEPTASPSFSSRLPVQLSPTVKSAIDMAAGMVGDEQRRRANRAEGQVTYFKRFEMQIRTGPDRYRTVHLHQGTEIDPRGASIRTGDRVKVGGVAQPDGSLDADAIAIVGK